MRLLNIVLFLLLLALQFSLWVGEGSVTHVFALQKKVDEQQALNDEWQARNEALGHEVIDLQHGTDAIEEYARSELGMVKPNETFFLVVSSKK
jgi:cell division protein FtsB